MAGIGTLLVESWTADSIAEEIGSVHRGLAEYVPGQFYLRELPCILPVIQKILSPNEISSIVIDGFVDLAPERPGLGRHLYRAIEQSAEIVGIAKSPFQGSNAAAVLRGMSQRPLWSRPPVIYCRLVKK